MSVEDPIRIAARFTQEPQEPIPGPGPRGWISSLVATVLGVTLVCLLLVGAVQLFAEYARGVPSEITVVNESGGVAQSFVITSSDWSHEMGPIPPGASAEWRDDPYSTSYDFEARFASNTIRGQVFGYVEFDCPGRARVTLRGDGTVHILCDALRTEPERVFEPR